MAKSTNKQANEKIIIVEFGGQYTHLISRRIRDLGAYVELSDFRNIDSLNFESVKGIILSGGPKSVGKENSPKLPSSLIEIINKREIPILGICYGHQLLAHHFGGDLRKSQAPEYGKIEVNILNPGQILNHYRSNKFNSWMSHGDHVETIGDEFVILANTKSCPVASMESKDQKIFGVQFHPEVNHTEEGTTILESFLKEICKIRSRSWDMKRYVTNLINQLRTEIGTRKVIIGVSGGVDSLVASVILKKAINDNLYPVFVNHGLLRKNEANEVQNLYNEILRFSNFTYVDAIDEFLGKLENVEDPERKRTIIGHTFIDVFERTAKSLEQTHGKIDFLAQGTIYPDRVESGAVGSGTAKIKSHHNLSLPDIMNLEIKEPLKELYKDEVRKMGRILAIPEYMLERYPFPGPGLSVRILGSIEKEKISILQEADAIFLDELGDCVDNDIWQAFAVLMAGKAVGVKGDNRAYGSIIALRAVQSNDGMTADFSRIEFDLLQKISTRIINEIPEVTRVLYDISTKPPGTIEFE